MEEAVLGKDTASDRGMALWKYFEARQGRSASFEEVGDVVVLMCTPQMSLVNGQNLFIDGYVIFVAKAVEIANMLLVDIRSMK